MVVCSGVIAARKIELRVVTHHNDIWKYGTLKCTHITTMLIFEAVEDLAMMYKDMSLLKQTVCRNQRYTVLQDTEKLDRSSKDQQLSMLCF